ncbi:ataxin-1-like [Anopheles marshallii]|uniref:ataxin-1-like n=1 Tax=Anopheles marshallii TaxID=1521116 RepID=UPI00237B328D|nr:ataxin-1-like [Anopheles marshallii]
MLSAVENLGTAGPGRVPYSRHHAHQPQHQHPAQHHGYHPLHTILSPSPIGQLQLPPMLGAQTSRPHPMPSVGNEFARPYPKQRYEENRGFGIPSALTVEQRLKYGDPPPSSAPGTNIPTHTQTGPVNLAVSNGGSAVGRDEFSSIAYTQCHQSANPPIQSEAGGSKYPSGALQPGGAYQQKYQQEQHQQMLDYLGAQQQTSGNRMVCYPAIGSLDVFGGYPPLNYDMYPYRRAYRRSTYVPPPNHRPLEARYTGGAAAFLPPRAPPPSPDAGTSRLPKAAAAPIAIKSKMWHLPSSSPPAPPTPSSLVSSHYAGRDIAMPTASSSVIATSGVDTLIESYRALKSAHMQHPYPRMWAPDPLQPSQANAAYLNDLPNVAGHDEDNNGPQYPMITHGTPVSHMPTLQDTYMAAIQQRHRPKFGSMPSASTDTSSTASLIQQEFKVPQGQGMEGLQKSRLGNIRVADPQLMVGNGTSYATALGAFDGAANTRRSNIEIESHELPEGSGGAHHQILHTTVLKPKMFLRGSLISFRNGVKKPVEQVRLEDFLLTAAISPDVRLTEAQTRRITPRYSGSPGDSVKRILVRFAYDQQQRHGALETTIDYPFFVTTKGWTSYSPERTFNSYGLECAPMEVGDVFIVLVPRHLSPESIRQEELSECHERASDHFPTQQNSESLHLLNVFSMHPNGTQSSPTEEHLCLQHLLQQQQQRSKASVAEMENASAEEQQREENGGSPTILVDDNSPITRDWMAATTSDASKAFGSGKRHQDGQRRATGKRKLAEMQSQEIFRQGIPDNSRAEQQTP